MTAGRSPLSVTYTALAFGSILAPYFFFRALMHLELPLRMYVVSALVLCTGILLVRFVGWSELDRWRKEKSAGVRFLINAITLVAFLYSLLVLLALSSFGGMTGGLMWFYALEALAVGTILALGPVLLLRPSSFERALIPRLTAGVKFAAFGLLLFLLIFACIEVLQFYRFQHPVY